MKILIVTMAGLSSRFSRIGLEIPKWQMRLNEKTMFYWSLISMTNWLERDDLVVFITRQEEGLEEIVDETCKELGIFDFTVVKISGDTKGQSHSALEAKKVLKCIPSGMDSPIAIWNIDTYVDSLALALAPKKGNWLALAQLEGDHWSFAKIHNDEIIETAEKVRISEWASVGLYGFENFSLLEKLVSEINIDHESYVAPLYNSLIQNGDSVEPYFVESESVHCFGTPEEVIETCAKMNWSVPIELEKLMKNYS